ncbi:MAG: 2-C-methyl-D-erythritol 2,4-cyclodiphosphate synthase [Deltaproteobacteria bacterium]|nr:2-C-methyl-D-erythritol 2,4-cyclodiphosphate synthase [Deltaproteobacteria bacterium]MBW1873603.1 2-C-methyl-D-erythritol 2,4-cyclodiphosphate synthase [Deltaproteobacteria bacterium]
MPALGKNKPNTWAIVPAAGQGVRFGTSEPKQFLAHRKTSLLKQTLRTLAATELFDGIAVVVPAKSVAAKDLLPVEMNGLENIRVVAGGRLRMDSVKCGLLCLPDSCEIVLVHDGVRPKISGALVASVIDGANKHGACVPVLAATETIKTIDQAGMVVKTLNRDSLRLVQTPQGFKRQVLLDAYSWAGQQGLEQPFTDDAALVEGSGQKVATVAGEPGNIKVTFKDDLSRIGWCVPRVGIGYDAHKLVPGRPLVLGGVQVPGDLGLLGHSDGDAAIHALIDAICGAAGMGDIGRHFPDSDPSYKDIASLELLGQIVRKASQAGWQVSSVDMTIVAQKPRLAEYLPGMADQMAAILGIDATAVGVKATTEEGMGFSGRLEGIAVHAVAVLVARVV